jgi:hypothetical protein
MATNAQLAGRLLRSAADFFRTVGEQNPGLAEHMETNAQSFELVADWVEKDPDGSPPVDIHLDDA